MGNQTGMDIAQVRDLARNLDAQANAIDAVIARINGLMNQGNALWHGPDFQRFQGWWQQQHRPRLSATAEAVRGLGRSAKNNADEQDRASNGVAAGVVGTAAVTTGAVSAAAATMGSAARVSGVDPAAVSSFVSAHPVESKINNGQCVWVFDSYNREVVHGPSMEMGIDPATGQYFGAKEYYEMFDKLPRQSSIGDFYQRVPASSGPPLVGDVVVWGSEVGWGAGHIAVVTSVDGNGSYQVIEQNAPKGAPVRVGAPVITSVSPIGYLRPTVR